MEIVLLLDTSITTNTIIGVPSDSGSQATGPRMPASPGVRPYYYTVECSTFDTSAGGLAVWQPCGGVCIWFGVSPTPAPSPVESLSLSIDESDDTGCASGVSGSVFPAMRSVAACRNDAAADKSLALCAAAPDVLASCGFDPGLCDP